VLDTKNMDPAALVLCKYRNCSR